MTFPVHLLNLFHSLLESGNLFSRSHLFISTWRMRACEDQNTYQKKKYIFFVVKVYLVRWYKENVNITICFMLIFRWLNTCFCLSPQKSIADSLVNIFFKKKCKSVVEICVPYLFYSHIRIKYYLFWLCSKILIVSFKSLIFNLCVPGSCFLWKYPKHNKSGFHSLNCLQWKTFGLCWRAIIFLS